MRSPRNSFPPLATLLTLFLAVTIAVLPGPADAGSGRLDRMSGGRNGAAIAKLGASYGPYLGKRCRHLAYPRCELIGVDIVLGRAASRVEAIAGSQRIRLRTPGMHSAVPHHDWVGMFTATDLARTHDSANRRGELLYVPVEFRIRFVDGRRLRGVFPHVLIAPGWG